jgi:hypothetical protein
MSLKGTSLFVILIGFGAYAVFGFFQSGEVDMPPFESVTWNDKIEVASGDADMGPWRMNDSEFHLVDDPSVSLNDEGTTAIAWADLEKQEIMLQIFEPDGAVRFGEPVTVPSEPGIFSWLPRILLSDDGERIFLLWQEIVFSGGSHGGEIYFTYSGDGGQTFNGPINLSNTEAGAGKGRFTSQRWFNGSYDLGKNGDGHIYAAWTEYEGALWFSRSVDGGETFTSPQHIDGGSVSPARAPSIAVGPDGTVHLAWSKGEGHQSNIFYAVSENGGQSFGETKVIHESSGHSDAPRIAVSPSGIVHLAWSESEEGLWNSYQILYSRKKSDEGHYSEPQAISGTAGGQMASSAYPSLRISGNEQIVVLWDLFPNLGQRPRGLGMAVSIDGGESFSSPGAVPGSIDPALGENGSRQGLFMSKLDVNNLGNIAVVNSTFNRGESSHIWLFRGELLE